LEMRIKMDRSFFEDQCSRLKATYSHSGFPEERVKLLWEKFRNVENRVFKNAVDYIISEFTTIQMPAISKFSDAVGLFRTKINSFQAVEMKHKCEPCRDFGFGWIGETIVACVCDAGKNIGPADLAKHQKNYEKGKRIFMEKNFQVPAPKPLPYDPGERIEY